MRVEPRDWRQRSGGAGGETRGNPVDAGAPEEAGKASPAEKQVPVNLLIQRWNQGEVGRKGEGEAGRRNLICW
jgi:hypothetical protein